MNSHDYRSFRIKEILNQSHSDLRVKAMTVNASVYAESCDHRVILIYRLP